MVDQSKDPASKAASADIGTSLGAKIDSAQNGMRRIGRKMPSILMFWTQRTGLCHWKAENGGGPCVVKTKRSWRIYVNGRPAGDVFPGARIALAYLTDGTV